jgi:hypothetical protein
MWRLKPEAPAQFTRLGALSIPLMILVAVACGAAAVGLWTGTRWGRELAVVILIVNLLGDTLNAVVRDDWRTLIGVPVGAALLAYLMSRRVRTWFA